MNRILTALLCALLLLALCACEAEKTTQEPESPQEEPVNEEEIPGYSILEGLPTIVLPEIPARPAAAAPDAGQKDAPAQPDPEPQDQASEEDEALPETDAEPEPQPDPAPAEEEAEAVPPPADEDDTTEGDIDMPPISDSVTLPEISGEVPKEEPDMDTITDPETGLRCSAKRVVVTARADAPEEKLNALFAENGLSVTRKMARRPIYIVGSETPMNIKRLNALIETLSASEYVEQAAKDYVNEAM